MLKLTDSDCKEILFMKEFGLLQDLDLSKLSDIKMPTCLICCSDGAQRKDINLHLAGILATLEADDLIHEFKDNGLPLQAVSSRIINPDFKTHLSLLNSIKVALGMSKIESRVINLGHYPCGVAKANNLSLRDCLELKVRSRSTISNALSDYNLNFSVAMQVDFTTSSCGKFKNTYHVETSRWVDYAAEVGYTPGGLYSKTASAF